MPTLTHTATITVQDDAPSMEAFMQQEGKALKPSFYVDRGDTLTQEQVQTLVNALNEGDKGGDILCGVECECNDYALEWEADTAREGFEAALKEYANTYTDTTAQGLLVHLEHTGELDALQDTFRDYIEWQNDIFSELVSNTAAATFAIYPMGLDGEFITDTQEIARLLGIDNPETMGQCYDTEALCICGSIDMQEVVQHLAQGRKLQSVTITPSDADSLLLHCGMNGSGNMGPIVPTLSVTLPAHIKHDASRKYGVQEVYGLTSRFWANEPRLVFTAVEA